MSKSGKVIGLPIVQDLQNDILGPLSEEERSAFLALESRVVRA